MQSICYFFPEVNSFPVPMVLFPESECTLQFHWETYTATTDNIVKTQFLPGCPCVHGHLFLWLVSGPPTCVRGQIHRRSEICENPLHLNTHYFHIIGDKLINPIVGVYIPLLWIPTKGGMCWKTPTRINPGRLTSVLTCTEVGQQIIGQKNTHSFVGCSKIARNHKMANHIGNHKKSVFNKNGNHQTPALKLFHPSIHPKKSIPARDLLGRCNNLVMVSSSLVAILSRQRPVCHGKGVYACFFWMSQDSWNKIAEENPAPGFLA